MYRLSCGVAQVAHAWTSVVVSCHLSYCVLPIILPLVQGSGASSIRLVLLSPFPPLFLPLSDVLGAHAHRVQRSCRRARAHRWRAISSFLGVSALLKAAMLARCAPVRAWVVCVCARACLRPVRACVRACVRVAYKRSLQTAMPKPYTHGAGADGAHPFPRASAQAPDPLPLLAGRGRRRDCPLLRRRRGCGLGCV